MEKFLGSPVFERLWSQVWTHSNEDLIHTSKHSILRVLTVVGAGVVSLHQADLTLDWTGPLKMALPASKRREKQGNGVIGKHARRIRKKMKLEYLEAHSLSRTAENRRDALMLYPHLSTPPAEATATLRELLSLRRGTDAASAVSGTQITSHHCGPFVYHGWL